MKKYMMATKAMHMTGDISSDKEDLCVIFEEIDTHYVGNWITGFGFIEVEFPKETTRELTVTEVEKYNKTYVQIANQPPIKLKVDS